MVLTSESRFETNSNTFNSFSRIRNQIASYSVSRSSGFTNTINTEKLLTQLFVDTRYTSDPSEISSHPNFTLIISQGKSANPELLEQINEYPMICCLLLQRINPDNQFEVSPMGGLRDLVSKWKEWAKSKNDDF